MQYPLPSGFPSEILTIEELIPPQKRVDTFFNSHSDWNDLTDDYLVSDLNLRAIPSMIAYEILKSLKDNHAFDKAILIGNDPLNIPPLSSFIKTYLPKEIKLEELSSLPSELDFQSSKTLVVTCLNKPRSIPVRNFGQGSIFLDFSFSTIKGKLYGDLSLDLRDHKSDYQATKVPGGTGLMIGAALVRNLYVAWKRAVIR